MVGGRLRQFAPEWESLGLKETLQRGLELPWRSRQGKRSLEAKLDGYLARLLDGKDGEKVEALLPKMLGERSIIELRRDEVKFVSPAFAIPKKDGSLRLIVDYRELNRKLRDEHFKMDSVRTVADLISQDDYAITLDLSQAYYLLPIKNEEIPYLAFCSKGRIYSFQGMPFGIKCAPREFTKIMRRVVKEIRCRWGIRVVSYLDDILLLHQAKQELARIREEVVRWMEKIGFIVNKTKSMEEPSQTFTFLGWVFRTKDMKVRLEVEKAARLYRLCRVWAVTAWKRGRYSARGLASLAGKIAATRLAYRDCSLWCSRMHMVLRGLTRSRGWNGIARLSPRLLSEIAVWAARMRRNEWRPFERPTSPQGVLTTDASPSGAGATLRLEEETRYFAKQFNEKVGNQSSNYRELKAVQLSLKHFAPLLRQRSIRVLRLRSDNRTVVYTLDRWRAAKNLLQLTRNIYRRLEREELVLLPEYVPGRKNIAADALSRLERSGDYQIKEEVLGEMLSHWGLKLTLDAFATLHNAQCGRWCGPGSRLASDGLNVNWKGEVVLVHPPIPLILRALEKISKERPTAVVLLPAWKGQVWEEKLKAMASELVIIPSAERVLLEGPWMRAVGAKLPPGPYMVALVASSERNGQ